MKRSVIVVTLVLFAASLVGCGGDTKPSAIPPSPGEKKEQPNKMKGPPPPPKKPG